jgi:NADH-ubiquinone oxidoreductase chain 4
LIGVLPLGRLILFLLCRGNISVPPSINFWSEIYIIGSILGFETFIILVFPLGSFLGVVFTLLIYSYTQHGKMSILTYRAAALENREILVLLLHIIPIYLLFLNIDILFI